MQYFHPQARGVRRGLVCAALAWAGVASGAELSFAHYAPGAGEVRVQLDGDAPRALRYGDFGALERHTAGTRRLRATRGDGSTLVESELPLRGDDRYVVALAGNGSEDAPYQFRVAIDHNVPLTGATRSVQHANLAIASGAMEVEESCGFRPHSDPERFGSGTAPAATPDQGSVNLGMGAGNTCRYRLSVDGIVRSELSVTSRAGERLRRFALGDGVSAPYELRLVQQEHRVEPSLAPSPALEGLWYPVGAPAGTSLQLAFDPAQAAGQRVSGLLLSYDRGGAPTWRVLDADLRLVDYRGGNPDGTQAVLPLRQSRMKLVVHACGEITLVPQAGSEILADGVLGRFPRHALRLTKLFPPGCPASFSAE